MIMVRWEDDSELVIYRNLTFIRKLIKQIERIAPPYATFDLGNASLPIKKLRLFSNRRVGNQMHAHFWLIEHSDQEFHFFYDCFRKKYSFQIRVVG